MSVREFSTQRYIANRAANEEANRVLRLGGTADDATRAWWRTFNEILDIAEGRDVSYLPN